MVVVMQERATDEQVQRVISQLVEMGFDVHRSTGALRTVIGAVGGNRAGDPRLLEVLDGVQEVLRITEPYKLASRTFKPENSVVSIGDIRIGGDEVIVMAGRTPAILLYGLCVTRVCASRPVGLRRPSPVSSSWC